MAEREKLIEIKDLQITFGSGKKKFVAVDHVNFDIYKGETFSLVGESGSGKTTIGRAITRINPVSAGEILFKGQRITGKISKELDLEVIKKCQMIFQDPMTSLNPVMTVGDQIAEEIQLHDKKIDKKQALDKAKAMLEMVGIPGQRAAEYPHQFSGGMKQRAALIRTLALDPQLLLLDEPFSALDYQTRLMVSADICRLIRQAGKTMIIVTHDLSEAISLADKVYVLSARPATIKAVLPIRLTLPDASPLAARNAPEFPYYFKQLWEELTDETTN